MFSKTRINEGGAPQDKSDDSAKSAAKPSATPAAPAAKTSTDSMTSAPKAKAATSLISSDLVITGNMKTAGDIQVEGTIEGDIRAHLLTVGEGATIRGEVVADDVIVDGRVVGRVRGLKVRLTSTARVEGDIIHKTIAIESGAHFEGSVQRQDDPLTGGNSAQKPVPLGAAAAEAKKA